MIYHHLPCLIGTTDMPMVSNASPTCQCSQSQESLWSTSIRFQVKDQDMHQGTNNSVISTDSVISHPSSNDFQVELEEQGCFIDSVELEMTKHKLPSDISRTISRSTSEPLTDAVSGDGRTTTLITN